MSVLETLAREHRIFEALIARLERGFRYPEELACAEWKKVFLILLPALERHEEIEDLVFENPAYLSQEGARRLLGEVERQHGKISLLHRDILGALEGTSLPQAPRLRTLVSQLAQRLRAHFHAEETRLWPHYRGVMSRSLDRCVDRRAKEKLKQLKREVASADAALADYLR